MYYLFFPLQSIDKDTHRDLSTTIHTAFVDNKF